MKVDKSKFICELDGYNYYLGEVLAKDVNWFEANIIIDELGDGWELPSRALAILAHNKFNEDMRSRVGFYWLGEHHSSSHCHGQRALSGTQDLFSNEYPTGSYVLPVYKEKSVDSKPKIKLLKVLGYSNLVLDIGGKKVLYEIGGDSAVGKGWSLVKHLDYLDVWHYGVVHEDFVEWLSEQQASGNTTKAFKKVSHIREKNEDGEVLARGGATVVFAETDAGFAAHIALCHPDDNYNKKVGVEVALSKDCYFKLPEVSDKFIKGTTPSYWKKVVKAV